jgi:hypothetical protein
VRPVVKTFSIWRSSYHSRLDPLNFFIIQIAEAGDKKLLVPAGMMYPPSLSVFTFFSQNDIAVSN